MISKHKVGWNITSPLSPDKPNFKGNYNYKIQGNLSILTLLDVSGKLQTESQELRLKPETSELWGSSCTLRCVWKTIQNKWLSTIKLDSFKWRPAGAQELFQALNDRSRNPWTHHATSPVLLFLPPRSVRLPTRESCQVASQEKCDSKSEWPSAFALMQH